MVGTQAFANLWKPSRKDPMECLHPREQRYIVTHPPDVFLQDRRNRRIYLSEMIVAYDSLQEERRTRSCPSMETFAQIWGSSALDTVWTYHWWLGTITTAWWRQMTSETDISINDCVQKSHRHRATSYSVYTDPVWFCYYGTVCCWLWLHYLMC